MSRRGWLLFGAMALLWGLPYVLIRVADRELDPVVLVAARTTGGALLLAPFAVRRGAGRALLAHWRWVLAYSVLEVAVPWLLLSTAEQRLPSALTGLLVSTVPLVAAVATRLIGGDDPITPGRLAGMAIGLAGVAVVLGIDIGGGQFAAVAEVGVVVLGYGTAPLIVSRRLRAVPPMAVIATSLALTAVIYLPFACTHLPARWPSAQVTASVAGLTVACTAAAFVVFFALIAEAGPNRALVVTFVNPLVALVLGVVLLGEHLTAGLAVGLPLILLGCGLATRRAAPPGGSQPAAAPAADGLTSNSTSR